MNGQALIDAPGDSSGVPKVARPWQKFFVIDSQTQSLSDAVLKAIQIQKDHRDSGMMPQLLRVK